MKCADKEQFVYRNRLMITNMFIPANKIPGYLLITELTFILNL